jgi:glycosyltransferase involved in cell wall biosynthesis
MLTGLVSELELNDKVMFIGQVHEAELKNAYAACDIFIFPAIQSWSLVAVEAMSAGKPVVVSDRCGVSEIIDDGKNGFIIHHENYMELADRITSLITDSKLRAYVGVNAREYVRQNLGWKKYALGMEAVFEDAIKIKS